MRGVGTLSKKERLPLIQQITRELYEKETDEMKAVVEAEYEGLKSASKDPDGDDTPQNYQRWVPRPIQLQTTERFPVRSMKSQVI
jgi:hypothetical protein